MSLNFSGASGFQSACVIQKKKKNQGWSVCDYGNILSTRYKLFRT